MKIKNESIKMSSDYKDLTGKEVNVFWKSGAQTQNFVERVNGAHILFKGSLSWVASHAIDWMEVVGEVEREPIKHHEIEIMDIDTLDNHQEVEVEIMSKEIITISPQEQSEYDRINKALANAAIKHGFIDKVFSDTVVHGTEFSVLNESGMTHIDFNDVRVAPKPKRISRPYKKPKAYQRHSEGGIWFVHHGNGKGIFAKGVGSTLEEAYMDWKNQHGKMQSRTRNGNAL